MTIKQLNEEEVVMEIERKKVGIKRNFTQIGDTFIFELRKNFKTFIIMLILCALMFTLFVIIQTLQEVQDVPLPDDPVDYFANYFQFIFGFLVVLTAAGFAGSIIAEDFQKQTGNLLFPKISKTRLFTGRILARFLMNALCIMFYYILVSSITFMKYGEIPPAILLSLGWALFYTFALFMMVTFVSSIMKSTSASIIVSIFLYLMVFNMIGNIMNFLAGGAEPWFLISYYENIITAILNMPDPRYQSVSIGGLPGLGGVSFDRWLTPDVPTAFWGILIYSVIFLTVAFIRYRGRQSKSES